MPDPNAYLKALLAAAGASAMIVLAFRLVLRKPVHSADGLICVLAVFVGLVTGYSVLQFSWSWPPTNALNRFLAIVLPAAVFVELLAGITGIPKKVLWLLRCLLYTSVGRILLHGSVYLSGIGSDNSEAWTLTQVLIMLCGGAGVVVAESIALQRLSQRSAPGSITISLAMAILCTGITTMLAGYIKGGAAAIPLAAALVGTTVASPLLVRGICPSGTSCPQGLIGIGVISLFSLLCIGRFFGQLTSLSATVIFLSPLFCWISEIPKLRPKAPWQVAGMRIFAVTLPLVAVLFAAKRDFDHKMAPLLAVEPAFAESRIVNLRWRYCAPDKFVFYDAVYDDFDFSNFFSACHVEEFDRLTGLLTDGSGFELKFDLQLLSGGTGDGGRNRKSTYSSRARLPVPIY